MPWPTTILIDTIFIPLYVILGVLNLANVFKHGLGQTSRFISLLIFSLVHLTGNILSVVSYEQDYSNLDVTVWGYILQSIGLSFLISASLAFWARARNSLRPETQKGTGRKVKLINLVNIGALVCVITGYTSTKFTDSNREIINPSLPVQAKVGAVLYVVLVAAIAILAFAGLKGAGKEVKIVKTAILVATPLMLVRSAYSVYITLKGDLLVGQNVWAKLVLQYITEIAALATYTALGFWLSKTGMTEEQDDVEALDNTASNCSAGSSAPNKEQWEQVPISFVPYHRQ